MYILVVSYKDVMQLTNALKKKIMVNMSWSCNFPTVVLQVVSVSRFDSSVFSFYIHFKSLQNWSNTEICYFLVSLSF